MRWVAGVLVAGSLGLSGGGAPSDLCTQFGPVEVSGTVAEPRLVELSGLAASPNYSDVLWAHNDSGGAPELFAFAEDGTSLGTYPVVGADAVDWEDIATGLAPNSSGGVLYIGDIGDNDAARPTVTVYRVYEPGGTAGATPIAPGVPLTEVEAIELRYPDGPSDAEALLIDPRTGDLVIVTKSLIGRSRVLTAEAASLVSGAPVELVDAGTLDVPRPPDPEVGLPGTAVTSGDVSPDGSIVLLRTYQSVLAFERGDDQTLAEALLGVPCFAPQEEEPQGEAIAFTWEGAAYVTASEGVNVPIHRVDIDERATTTTSALSTTTTVNLDDDVQETAQDRWPSIIGAAVLVVVLVAGVTLIGRRRRASDPG